MAMSLVASPLSSSNDTIFETDSPSVDEILVGSEAIGSANYRASSKRSDNRGLTKTATQTSTVSDASASSASSSVQFTTPPMEPTGTFIPQSREPASLASADLHIVFRDPEANKPQPIVLPNSLPEFRRTQDDQSGTVNSFAGIYEKGSSNHSIETFQKLEGSLQSCWPLLTNFASLLQSSWSSTQVHPRPTVYSRPSLSGSAWSAAVPENSGPLWLPCWELVQKLYTLRASSSKENKATILLDLVRPFAQYCGRIRSRADETADGILRTALALGDHMYSFTDQELPNEFWERALDFHVTLSYRFLKQRGIQNSENIASGHADEDSVLLACWTVAETLLILLKSQRHNVLGATTESSDTFPSQDSTDMDLDQLSSAVQACYTLEDTFRLTCRHRIDFDTPKPIQPASFDIHDRNSALTHSRSRLQRAQTSSSDIVKFEPENYQIEPPLDSAMAPSEYTATTATIDESDSLYSFGDFSPRSNSPFQSPLGIRNISDGERMRFSRGKPPQALMQSFRRSLSFEDHKNHGEDSGETIESRFFIGKLRRLSSSFASKMPETPSTIFEDIDHHPGLNFEDESGRESVDGRGIHNLSLPVGPLHKDELATAIQRFAPMSTLRSRRSSTGSIADQVHVATSASLLQTSRQDSGGHSVKPQAHMSSTTTEELPNVDNDDAKRVSRSSSALSQSTAMPASVKRHDSGS